MKSVIFGFIKRGLIGLGFGPLVLAILYLILSCNGVITSIDAIDVSVAIFSISALAFIAGGMNVVYQIERLPLAFAILIQGVVLYFSYLATYLINGWLADGLTPILIFTGIFIVGYLAILAIIYLIVRKRTESINENLKQKQSLELTK